MSHLLFCQQMILAVKNAKIGQKLSFHGFIWAILGQNRHFLPISHIFDTFYNLKFKNIIEFWRKNSS